MKELLRSYSKRLTNLTSRNRSLMLLRLYSHQYIDLHSFNFLHKDSSFTIIEKLVSGKSHLLCEEFDSRDKDVNNVSRQLKRLLRTDKFIYEEQGTRDLHVGWPFIRGKFSDGSPVRCALVYIPVQVELKNGKYYLHVRGDVGITLNKSFLLAFGHYNEVKIPDELLEFDPGELDEDMTVFRTGLYQLLEDSPLDINFNRDNFMDELRTFEEFRKDDFDKAHENGVLRMYPEAVLGIFPQSGSNLVPDYEKLMELDSFRELDQFFEQRTLHEEGEVHSEYFYLHRVSEEKTFTPYPTDAYQENALKAVKKGYSVVVQGPPGTGKSQLICNLVSDFVARGKKVLIVSQKRAALDVVYARLMEKHLEDFSGLVHDYKDDRKIIYEKIARQIRKIPEYESNNNSLDLVQLERRFLQLSRRIDQLIEELDEFRTALYDTTEFGISAKELYLISDKNRDLVNFRQEYQYFSSEILPDFLVKLRSYAEYGKKYSRTDYPLLERKSFAEFGVSELKKMENTLDEIPLLQEKIKERSREILDVEMDVEDAELIISRRSRIIEMLNIIREPRIFHYFMRMSAHSDNETDQLWLRNTERVLMECYKGHGPELSLSSDQLGKFQEVLERVLEARKRLVKLLKWKLFSEDKYMLKRVLVANGLKNNREDLQVLVEKVDNRLNLEHNISKLREVDWLLDIPEDYQKIHIQNWFHDQKLALQAKLIYSSVRGLREYFNLFRMDFAEIDSKLEKLFKVIHEIPERRSIWELYFSKTQISNILLDPSLAGKIKKTLQRDFDSLCEFDALKEELKEYERRVLDESIAQTDSDEVNDIEEKFLNSLYVAWINHIEAKYPILRSVSSRKFLNLESELQRSVAEKLQISNEILLLKVREQTYEDIEYNRLNNRVTYRDLDHQVNKKRRIWPVRKLMQEYRYELFDLLPCWLASPESVSAIFPMENLFDLVIFDEASQCFTEKGIPAMYRGKQLVIAGDTQQLRPNDLYTVRYDEDVDEDPNLEISSVLELAERHLMSVSLKGHYRSQSLELIGFSNRHFYENKLILLPDRERLNRAEPAIRYIRVDGVWRKNRNEAEADRVIALIDEIRKENPGRRMGVVTFNHAQRELIQDKLDQHSVENNYNIPGSLFIKNIENVQGDERDIIIFSIGYAPDKAGRMTMQFGSLNQEFGENRLNVAVTRAREKIYIVSSIMPSQLKVEDTRNRGPKLLKSYLEYAWEVSEGNWKPQTLPPERDRHWYLKNRLADWSKDIFEEMELQEDMPFADLTIKEGGTYRGLIKTDDDLYFNSPSVKDAHVYMPALFSERNWLYLTIMSRQFWNDPGELKERLTTFITNRSVKSG